MKKKDKNIQGKVLSIISFLILIGWLLGDRWGMKAAIFDQDSLIVFVKSLVGAAPPPHTHTYYMPLRNIGIFHCLDRSNHAICFQDGVLPSFGPQIVLV